ncbi:MAG TPA: VOC family protein, partial [Reyranella sp.]
MIDHLSITTTDLDRAQAFYDAALGALGYPRVHRCAEAMGYGVRDHGPDAAPYISIYLCTG